MDNFQICDMIWLCKLCQLPELWYDIDYDCVNYLTFIENEWKKISSLYFKKIQIWILAVW